MMNVKDANGQWVVINDVDLMTALVEAKTTLFGMSMNAILRMRQEYIEKNGIMPMNEKNINEFYSRPTPRPYKDNCDA